MKSLQSVVAGQRRAARRTAKPDTAPEPPIEENSIRWRVQTAFASASPLMGVPLRVHQLVAYLLTKWSYEQDWESGATPLTWPSNSVIMSGLGITLATLKRTNRAGEELGLFTLSGDSQGRRRGCRSPAGHIRFAYGYDLSPLRTRYREMLTITARNIELTRELTDLLTRLRTTRRRALSTLTRLPTEPDLITHTKALELDARLAALGASNHGRECPFCGHPERPQFLKIWATHEFMLETCCADFHDNVVQEMAFDPEWARAILRQLGAEVLTGHRLRRLADDGACGMILEWQLATNPISHAVARAFVTTHHAYCGAPVTWRFGQSVWNWQTLLGVVMVGNPVARAFNGRQVLEVNRLCLRRDIPRALAWNAASMLYGWSAREAERRGWQRIITYTRADEDGTSLKAAGWTKEAEVRGRG